MGDDIGQSNISAYTSGLMGYWTQNIDRIASEGMRFTRGTAGRSSFITGQATLRTGLSKVGVPGAAIGLQARDASVAELLKPLGYATGQFGKNHLGDRNEFLPTVHGFDEFFRKFYHLNAEEDPESRNYSPPNSSFSTCRLQFNAHMARFVPKSSHTELGERMRARKAGKSRGSRTLGEPGGESPPGYSTKAPHRAHRDRDRLIPKTGPV